jgi:selenocysteine lyase/cysteine desulfurase
MPSRRNFIQKTTLLGAAVVFGSYKLNASPSLPSEGADDEKYWRKVRAQFPLTEDKIYLNNGTMGVSPYSVVNEVRQDMLKVDTQAQHAASDDLAIKALAKYLNTKDSEISLTHNVTEGINIVCWGLPLIQGDEIIITNNEHAGHASPWLNRRKISGIKLIVIALGKTAEETLHNINKAITKKTKLISVPHIPCTNGQVLPAKEICTLAKQRGIWSFLDGAHPPGMLQLDLKDIGCDFYASCCHKWMLGPKGTGFLYVSEEKRDIVTPLFAGAGVDTGWNLISSPQEYTGYRENGHRYFFGTQNTSLYKGIIKAIEFQNQIGTKLIETRVKYLANYLQENLIKLSKEIEMLTPIEDVSKAAQISFKVKNKNVQDLQNQCYEQNIITRFVPENEINCLRISTHIYNNTADLDYLLTEVDKFVRA